VNSFSVKASASKALASKGDIPQPVRNTGNWRSVPLQYTGAYWFRRGCWDQSSG